MKFAFAAMFLLIIVIKEVPAQVASISDALLIDRNLKNALNVQKETSRKDSKIWFVPNGMSIPNYMLLAVREIERCKGRVLWMREIRGGKAALFEYEGEQGVYPVTEIRIIDTLWMPNSSKLSVVLAVKEQNLLLKNKPEVLEKIDFNYNLLIPSSRPELLAAAKKTKANIIPWVPMESREMVYATEKRNQLSIGASEKDLISALDSALKKYDNASGFTALYGEDFLAHAASVERFGKVLQTKNLWFWDLSKRGSTTLTLDECKKRGLRCRKDYLDAGSEELINKALRTARRNGSAVLLFELNEKSIELLQNLPSEAEKQGTVLVFAPEVF